MTDSAPFRIGNLDHVVIRTAQPDALLDFYLALGCTVAREVPDLGLQQLWAGSSVIDLVDADGLLGQMGGPAPGPEGRNMDHFALRIEPFDRDVLHAHFDAAGIEWADPPVDLFGAEGVGPALYVKDPDGNTVELKGPPNDDQTDPLLGSGS